MPATGATLRAAEKASGLVDRLSETDGRSGFAQRELKKQFLDAMLAEAPAGPSGDGGMKVRNIDADADVAVQAVQVVDNKVLYKRGNVWYSFDVAKRGTEKLAGKAKVVERFSREYFEMVDKASPAAARMLSRQKGGEEMMIEVDGKVYHVK